MSLQAVEGSRQSFFDTLASQFGDDSALYHSSDDALCNNPTHLEKGVCTEMSSICTEKRLNCTQIRSFCTLIP